MNVETLHIKENSWVARFAAWKLKSSNVAIVIGQTIHLYGVSKADFLKDERWVKHECCHLQQYRDHGFFGFIFKYLVESVRKGYYNNRFEVEARKAEEL